MFAIACHPIGSFVSVFLCLFVRASFVVEATGKGKNKERTQDEIISRGMDSSSICLPMAFIYSIEGLGAIDMEAQLDARANDKRAGADCHVRKWCPW